MSEIFPKQMSYRRLGIKPVLREARLAVSYQGKTWVSKCRLIVGLDWATSLQ